MLQNLLIITIIFGILHSEHSVIRPSSKVSVKVQDILTRQDAGSGRSSIARVIVPGVGLRPELPQSNPPSNTNLNNFMRSFQNYDLERSNNDTLRPSSDYWTLKRLRRILRKDFDPEWMSIAQPNLESLPYGYPKPNLDLIKSVDQLDFNMTNIYPGPIQPEHVALFKNWLISKSSCQIKFIWDNLGDLFWPKFIRRGVCQNSAGSCSWPPGMGCKLGGGKTLKILRWKCDNQVPEEPLRRLYRRDNRQVGPWSPDFRRLKRQNISSQKRRENRLRRLIRQLSVTKNGLHCRWTHYEHVISDECICGCN